MLWQEFESVTFRWVVFIMVRVRARACLSDWLYVCICMSARLLPSTYTFFFCGRRCRDWRVLFSLTGLKHQIHTLPCSGRMCDRLPTFLRTCFCAMTRVDFCRNPWSTSPGNNNTAKCVTSQFALPLRVSGTMRRINKSKAPREFVQQTLMPLQIPGSTQEISPSAPAPRQTNPSGERAEEDHVEEMQLQQQQSTQQKENAASVSALRSELRCILVAASEQSPKRFPACKHFHRTILESGGLLLHRTVVFIYLRIKAWLPSRSPCAAAPPSSWDVNVLHTPLTPASGVILLKVCFIPRKGEFRQKQSALFLGFMNATAQCKEGHLVSIVHQTFLTVLYGCFKYTGYVFI